MNAELYPAWVDGRIVAPGAPALCVDDMGFQLGLAVFDTLLQEDGCRFFEEDHVQRLARGAASLGLPWPPPLDPARALAEYSDALAGADCVMRLTYSRGVPGRGPTLVVSGRAVVPPPPEGALVSIESGAKLAGHRLEAVKATSRLRNVLAREAAMAEGAFEALLCTDEGDVAEGTISNVFVVKDGRLATPALERGLLAGITRDKLLEDLRRDGETCEERRVEVEELESADEVFLTNSTGRVIPVRGILGRDRALPGPAGPVVRRLRERFARIEARYRARSRE